MNDNRQSIPGFIAPYAMLVFLAELFVLEINAIAASPDVAGSCVIDKYSLMNKRFQFSWSSGEQGGINGIALLKEEGFIEGIPSPNETTWIADSSGRLVFKHADGRVSTRFDKVWMEAGLLHFEGSFLFKEGIIHHLIEIKTAPDEQPRWITPELTKKIRYSTQQFVYLDPGEAHFFRLRDGSEKRIQLVSVKEYQDSVIHLTRRAKVNIEIDGKPIELTCSPYCLPSETQGIRIQADTTSAWLNIPKRVQFSIWDAQDPVVDTNLFCFPLPEYRLFSHGVQSYNEPVHLGHRDGDPEGQRFYHNYGVDWAGYEGRQKVVSCIDGVIIQVNPQEGDISIRDERGFILYFGHLDSILTNISVGSRVHRGQWIGMLGKRGASGNFSHLHIGAFLSQTSMAEGNLNRNLNLYPWLIKAYQKKSETNFLAVARPHCTALTGESVHFDGTNSISIQANRTSYRWEFHDGTVMNGPKADKVFDKPGCYSACLWIEDDHGNRDVDFCTVKVFSRPVPEKVIPTLFVTYYPSGEIFVEDPVNFRIWPQGETVENIRIDFGDGTLIQEYRIDSAITHRFKTSGIHIVSLSGTAGKLPVMHKVKVIVQR